MKTAAIFRNVILLLLLECSISAERSGVLRGGTLEVANNNNQQSAPSLVRRLLQSVFFLDSTTIRQLKKGGVPKPPKLECDANPASKIPQLNPEYGVWEKDAMPVYNVTQKCDFLGSEEGPIWGADPDYYYFWDTLLWGSKVEIDCQKSCGKGKGEPYCCKVKKSELLDDKPTKPYVKPTKRP